MWTWIKAHAGQKLNYKGQELWFSVDKPSAERKLGTKVGHILKKLETFFGDKVMSDDPKEKKRALKEFFDADSSVGAIWVQDPTTKKKRKAIMKPKDSEDLEVVGGAPEVDGLVFLNAAEPDVRAGQIRQVRILKTAAHEPACTKEC